MITCIAIDDEPLALKQMAGYIEKTPFLELAGQFESALQAISWLQENQGELMFVDINMPDLNGMEFVKSLNKPPGVIFTTYENVGEDHTLGLESFASLSISKSWRNLFLVDVSHYKIEGEYVEEF